MRIFKQISYGLSAVLMAVIATGCGSNGVLLPNPANTPPAQLQFAQPRFDLTSGSLSDIPFPNDLLRDPNTGLNNLPAPNATTEPQASFNTIAGFSTAGTIAIPFTGALDPKTVNPNTVLLFDLGSNVAVRALATPTQANVTITLGTDGHGNSIVNLTPTVPLSRSHEFVAVVTGGVKSASDLTLTPNPTLVLTQQTTSLLDGNGHSVIPGVSDAQAQALEPVRLAMQPVWAAAEAATGQKRAQIPDAFGFGTQSEFTTLQSLAANAIGAPPTPTVSTPAVTLSGNPLPSPVTIPNPLTQTSQGLTINQFLTQLAGAGPVPPNSHIGTVIFGSFQAPNFQTPSQTASTPPGVFVQPTPGLAPLQNGTNTIDFIVCLPAGASTAVPAVIFQHGFNRTNFDVFAIADSICAGGEGVIAINLVLHGDRSLQGQTSGTGFVNLAHLLLTRDNIRQSESDLYQLAAMVAAGNTNFLGTGNAFTTADPEYVGQSLGGIVGTTLAATDGQIPTAVLNVPGGRLTSLFATSPAFEPTLQQGLQSFGIAPGSPEFAQFLYLAQTIIDDADPFNYAPHLGVGASPARDLVPGTPTLGALVQEMLGDQVVPNSALNDLALAADITQVNGGSSPLQTITTPPDTTFPFTLPFVSIPQQGLIASGLFQFQGGEHGFLLAPSAEDPNGILTFEGQQQAVTYLVTALSQNGIGTIIVPTPPALATPRSRDANGVNPQALFRTR